MSGVNENRMYGWMGMFYGVKCSGVMEEMEGILE
jgi:hypothetical protein